MGDTSRAEVARDEQAARGLRIGDEAPGFRARTTRGEVALRDFRGRWLLFFSHPADFTPVCTSEFVALAQRAEAFAALDCALLGLSVDSLHAHVAWMRAIRQGFGLEIPFPVVEDPSMAIGRAYGMVDSLSPDSSSVRASFVIDPEGIIRAILWYPMQVGRSADELLRLVAALRRSATGEVLTPAGWQPGDDVLMPSLLSADELATSDDPRWFCRTRPDR